MVAFDDLLIYATFYALGALSLYIYQLFSSSTATKPLPQPIPAQYRPAPPATISPALNLSNTPVVNLPSPKETVHKQKEKKSKKRSGTTTATPAPAGQQSEDSVIEIEVTSKDATPRKASKKSRETDSPSFTAMTVPLAEPASTDGLDWSSPPTSPASYPLTSREDSELRALRADVESLKLTLASTAGPRATVSGVEVVPGPSIAVRLALSDNVKLSRVPSPTYGPLETYTSVMPVLKKGWLELRTFKMYNRRYFILHGNWLTYFKDEKMRRGECYGHICLNDACEVHELNPKERTFIIKNKSKTESLFRTRGPGINAATTHRMMHAASSKIVMRSDLLQLSAEWVAAISSTIAQLTSSPGQIYYVSPSESGESSGVDGWQLNGGEDPTDYDDNGQEGSGQRTESRHHPLLSKSVGSRTPAGTRRHGEATGVAPVRVATTPAGDRWKKRTQDASGEVLTVSTTTTSTKSAHRPPRRRHSEDDADTAGLGFDGNDGEGAEEDTDTETSSDDGEEEEERPIDEGAEFSSDDREGACGLAPVAEEFDYQWPPEQMAAVEELKATLGDKYWEEGCSRFMLWRFLKARSFDITLALQMLNEYFVWRSDYRPAEITVEEVGDEIALGKAYFIGYDLHQRPIMVCHPGRHDPKTSSTEHFMRFVCFMLEVAIKQMKPPVQQFTCIVDMQGFGMSSLDSNMAKTAAHMLQSYYPERLGVLVAVNCGLVLNVAWRMVKSLLDERTRNKINFIKGVKDVPRLGIFDLDALPLQYGGNAGRTLPPGSYGLEFLLPQE